MAHMRDNANSAAVQLAPETIEKLNSLINETTVQGTRYTLDRMASTDSENDVKA